MNSNIICNFVEVEQVVRPLFIETMKRARQVNLDTQGNVYVRVPSDN